MRVVIDTPVFVGACLGVGASSAVFVPHRRHKALPKSRGTPLNRLMDGMTTVVLAEFDAETRFRLRAARVAGQEAVGLQLLHKAMAS